MPRGIKHENIPVILLYNVDPDWKQEEKNEVVSLSRQLGNALIDIGHPTVFVTVRSDNISSPLAAFHPRDHIVFNWCESLPGVKHSEWLVAKKLEMLGFTFTGAGSKTLALSQDKYRVKKILEKARVPTPAWRIFHHPDSNDWDKFPAIVKPVNEHSSEGITPDSVVMTQKELQKIIGIILDQYKQPVLVEDFIDGREFHVTVWGNELLEVLPPAEMDFSFFTNIKDRLCTYDSKFTAGTKHYEKIKTLLPAPLKNKEIEALEKICKDAYRAVECRDYARFDIRHRDGIFYVLDVNPNADISSDASMACAAEIAGFSYGQMGSRIVKLAARRHPNPIWKKN
jgi:D-alanine-D-alanine ligase